jgi:hypothetical protein
MRPKTGAVALEIGLRRKVANQARGGWFAHKIAVIEVQLVSNWRVCITKCGRTRDGYLRGRFFADALEQPAAAFSVLHRVCLCSRHWL